MGHYHFKHLYLIIGGVFGLLILGAILVNVFGMGKVHAPVIAADTPIGQVTYTANGFQPAILNMKLDKQVAVVFINESDESLTIQSGTTETPEGVVYPPLNINKIPSNNVKKPAVVTFDEEGIFTFHNVDNASQSGTILVVRE
jgi:hypothetical protein